MLFMSCVFPDFVPVRAVLCLPIGWRGPGLCALVYDALL